MGKLYTFFLLSALLLACSGPGQLSVVGVFHNSQGKGGPYIEAGGTPIFFDADLLDQEASVYEEWDWQWLEVVGTIEERECEGPQCVEEGIIRSFSAVKSMYSKGPL